MTASWRECFPAGEPFIYTIFLTFRGRSMRLFRPFIPSLAMLLMASSGASSQGVLIDKSEVRFISKQLGMNVEGRFRKWKANVDFRPKDLAHSKANFEIDVG